MDSSPSYPALFSPLSRELVGLIKKVNVWYVYSYPLYPHQMSQMDHSILSS